MPKPVTRSLAVALVAAGGVTARKLYQLHEQRNPGAARTDSAGSARWNVVTVASEHRLAPEAGLPAPLDELRERIDVRFAEAPGGRGTEISARPKDGDEDEELRGLIRQALRDSKQLIETGEILHILPRSEGRRPATPTGALVDMAERIGKKGGVL